MEYETNFNKIPTVPNTFVTKENLSTSYVKIENISIQSSSHKHITVNSEVNIIIKYLIIKNVKNFGFTIILKDAETDQIVFSSISNLDEWYSRIMLKGRYATKFVIPKSLLNDKLYIIDLNIFIDKYHHLSSFSNIIKIRVYDDKTHRYDYNNKYEGVIRPLIDWKTYKI